MTVTSDIPAAEQHPTQQPTQQPTLGQHPATGFADPEVPEHDRVGTTARRLRQITETQATTEQDRPHDEGGLLNKSAARAIPHRYARRGLAVDDPDQVAYV